MQKHLVKQVADRAMEIHRCGKKTTYPLAIYEAVGEKENLTEKQRLKLTTDVYEELSRRKQLVRDAQSRHKRRGNQYHDGVVSSIHRSRERISAIKAPKVGNTLEERRRQKKLEQQTREAETMAKERHDELLPDDS